jgi:hypothetical protein
LAILFVFVCQISAKSVSINSVDVIPNQPLNTDLITFNIVGGAATTPSWVEYDQFSQNGTSLQLDLYVDRGPYLEFSNWGYSKQIQPLLPGIYSIEVRAFDNWYGTLQDTRTVDFTVVPEPATLLLLGLGGLVLRKHRR